MPKEAIIFGAGNIGRGFIGQLFSESGFRVTFVDVDEELVATLDRDGQYHLQTVFNEDIRDYSISPVRAIHGGNVEAVAAAVATAEIGATAVGAGALKFIAPAMAAGIAQRSDAGAPPLNIIICENLKGAAAHMRGLVAEHLDGAAADYAAESVGFVDTVIGRMVPIPTPEMRASDVSMIRVEPYKELPVDRAGFVGPVPDIVAMEPQDNFPLYTARKLYVHNCGHALLAYTGYLRGYEFGYEAMRDADVRRIMNGGLRESVGGIVAEYGADRDWLESHLDDLLARFANRVLADTIFRLGRDPIRKLGATDRLVGAANLAQKHGTLPEHLAWGIASALLFDPADDPSASKLQEMLAASGPAKALAQVAGIDENSPLSTCIIRYFQMLQRDRLAVKPG